MVTFKINRKTGEYVQTNAYDHPKDVSLDKLAKILATYFIKTKIA